MRQLREVPCRSSGNDDKDCGADTAVIIKSCHSDDFFDEEKGMEFREIIAMPRKKKYW